MRFRMGRVLRRQALSQSPATETIETAGLVRGLYFWEIVSAQGERLYSGKVVLQRD